MKINEKGVLISEYLIGRPEVDSFSRIILLKKYIFNHPYLSVKFYFSKRKLPPQQAIDLLREKIKTFRELYTRVTLNKTELKLIHGTRGVVNLLEKLLRNELKKQNPEEFTRKKKQLEEAVREYEEKYGKEWTKKNAHQFITQSWILELAKENGYSVWLSSKIITP